MEMMVRSFFGANVASSTPVLLGSIEGPHAMPSVAPPCVPLLLVHGLISLQSIRPPSSTDVSQLGRFEIC